LSKTTNVPLRILFVDDEPGLREFMKMELPRMGHTVTVCPDSRTAMETLQKNTFDAAILDMKMENDRSGLQVLTYLKQISPDTEAVIMTGYATQETIIEALRLGAFDYLTKPCKLTDIEGLLLRVQEKRRLKNQAAALEVRATAAEGSNTLIGSSPAMAPVQRLIDTVAPSDATVLITGETGTGKEMVARTLFQKSKRAEMPFVPVNCGALSPTLVESQLFGHRKGSFTGADKDHKGFFEVANGGTLFLDELGELDKNIQVKLLRFLENREINRLGDNSPITADVRVICATNRDLRKMITEGTFREDLLYRLNTFEIGLPPLRERKQDLASLAITLLARSAKRPTQQLVDAIGSDAMEVMLQYDWPGNVRELANAMEYSWIVSGGQQIRANHLPTNLRVRYRSASEPSTAYASEQRYAGNQDDAPATLPMPTIGQSPVNSVVAFPPPAYTGPTNGPRSLADVEMEFILQVYSKHGGNKQRTAEELGISLKTLYNKLHKYEEDRLRAQTQTQSQDLRAAG
jgi:DNA-binding NtrC family response regulator